MHSFIYIFLLFYIIICHIIIGSMISKIKKLNKNINDLVNESKLTIFDSDDEIYLKDREKFLSKLSFSNISFKREKQSYSCYVDITFLKNNKTFAYKFECIDLYPRFFVINEKDNKELRNIFTNAEKEWLKKYISSLYSDYTNELRKKAMIKEKIESDKNRKKYL